MPTQFRQKVLCSSRLWYLVCFQWTTSPQCIRLSSTYCKKLFTVDYTAIQRAVSTVHECLGTCKFVQEESTRRVERERTREQHVVLFERILCLISFCGRIIYSVSRWKLIIVTSAYMALRGCVHAFHNEKHGLLPWLYATDTRADYLWYVQFETGSSSIGADSGFYTRHNPYMVPTCLFIGTRLVRENISGCVVWET